MSQQQVIPRFEVRPTRKTLGSLACGLNMPPASPTSSEVFVAYATTPFTPGAVEHGIGFAAI